MKLFAGHDEGFDMCIITLTFVIKCISCLTVREASFKYSMKVCLVFGSERIFLECVIELD